MTKQEKILEAAPGTPADQVEVIAEAIEVAVDPIYSSVDQYLRTHLAARKNNQNQN